MASYHTSFSYLGKNSTDYGLIIAAFDPDTGLTDTFLSMDIMSDDYYDGTKRYTYNSRYNTQAEITITVVNSDGRDFSVQQVRDCLKWLTGARVDSWLEMKDGDKATYSFLGRITNVQNYKLDARIVGLTITFTSVSPWAFSSSQTFDRNIEQRLFLADDGTLYQGVNDGSSFKSTISIGNGNVLCNSEVPSIGACFRINDQGVVYVDNMIVAQIDNQSDDLYSYIYLDITFENDTCNYLIIKNETLNETTEVKSLKQKDIIKIHSKQFITAYSKDQLTGTLINQNRIFGDDFNFVWPRLKPGVNNLVIEGSGNGKVTFEYRYPMKIGDCAIDVL